MIWGRNLMDCFVSVLKKKGFYLIERARLIYTNPSGWTSRKVLTLSSGGSSRVRSHQGWWIQRPVDVKAVWTRLVLVGISGRIRRWDGDWIGALVLSSVQLSRLHGIGWSLVSFRSLLSLIQKEIFAGHTKLLLKLNGLMVAECSKRRGTLRKIESRLENGKQCWLGKIAKSLVSGQARTRSKVTSQKVERITGKTEIKASGRERRRWSQKWS